MSLIINKPIAVNSFFKSVSAKQATPDHPEGEKRPDVKYEIFGLDESILCQADTELIQEEATQIATIVNASLVEFSKKLLAENANNWDYVPSKDEVTIQALYEDIIRPSTKGNRILSKAALQELATMYEKFAVSILGKSPKVAANGAKVINLKLVPILGNSEALTVFSSNLITISEKSDTEPEIAAVSVPLNAMLEMLSDLLGGEISSEDL